MSVRRTTTAAVLLLLLTTAWVTACGSSPGKATSASPLKAPPPTAEARSIVLPFDAYGLSTRESARVSTATDILIKKCMRGRGHDWKLIHRPTPAAGTADTKNRRRYGVIEPTVAKRFGYHAPEQVLGPDRVEKAEAARENGLTSSARSAALSEHGGCVEHADSRLGGVSGAQYDRLNGIDAHVFEAAQKSPRLAMATKAWRTCMRTNGFNYVTPARAIDDRQWWSHKNAAPSHREITTATTDVTCKKRTDLASLSYATEKSLQKERITSTPSFFHSLASAKAKELKRARDVIAHG